MPPIDVFNLDVLLKEAAGIRPNSALALGYKAKIAVEFADWGPGTNVAEQVLAT